MSRIRNEILDDGAAFGGFGQVEQGFAGHPAVFDGFLPRGAVFFRADDDVKTVVAHIERLSRTLDAITEYGDGFIF